MTYDDGNGWEILWHCLQYYPSRSGKKITEDFLKCLNDDKLLISGYHNWSIFLKILLDNK